MTTLLRDTLEHESIYIPTPMRIVAVKKLTELEKLFTFALPSGYSLNHRPGQFVEVSVLGVGEAPISITSSPSRTTNNFDLCIRAVGNVTNALHRLNVGDVVGIRGPFGRGFPFERFRSKDLLFVSGGLGLAPLRSLINQVLDERGMYERVTVLYGARTPSDLLFKDDLKLWEQRDDLDLHLTVDHPDDTWNGNIGVITTLFKDIRIHARNTVAVVVGPPVMYRFVLMELLGKGIVDGNIWFSFERRMKCGVGKCGHCQLHHIYTCQEGPSFTYADIKHLEEAL